MFKSIKKLFKKETELTAHTKILQGLDVWNKWREENPEIKPDLEGINLNGANLCKANFGKTNLFGANLFGANLDRATMIGAVLEGANLHGANLTRANLHGAMLDGANLHGAVLDSATLHGARLTGAVLGQASLEKANLFEANLEKANLFGANLEQANLFRANLSHANLSRSSFIRANLSLADLSRANLSRANLSRANLIESKLTLANMTAANITGAKLYGTARDNWKIDSMICDYVFWDIEGRERTPKHRDFKPGEFEALYEQLPVLEYFFQETITPVDVILMNQITASINAKHPDFELKLNSWDLRGRPHAAFTVIHKNYSEQALKEITEAYENWLDLEQSHKDRLLEIFSIFVKNPQMIYTQTIQTLIQVHSGK
ncbi:Pentapeptide repeat-containing protein [Desulfonema limicola]|uniref:Pentapeptide repeat-containing protein n=1 Tax=Desulfonema limicola TaxID=45656 RepID=A0A975BC02_9BACT|nr:pentapeptide repeat-containing protein [Desulfonema limicola]QTA82533.1 Pentapeptide repeat-containing protein [Desulfonema limicola]